jgi:ubiquinone/menaquinone biosynthesis C-methylase UbiE
LTLDGVSTLSGKRTPSTIDLDRDMISRIPHGARTLEFACAWGRTAFELEKMGFKVTAFDINPDMIAEAALRAERLGSRIELLVADGCNLPFDDMTFDACIMNGFLTMLDEEGKRKASVNEAARVLAPGGHLYIADFLQTWSDPVYAERYRFNYPITGEMGTFIVTDEGNLEGIELYRAHHYTVEELLELLDGRFSIITSSSTTFTSFHGNRVDGMKLLCKKNRIETF